MNYYYKNEKLFNDELVPIWDSGAQFYKWLGANFDLEVDTILVWSYEWYNRTFLSAWCWDYALREVYAFREVR